MEPFIVCLHQIFSHLLLLRTKSAANPASKRDNQFRSTHISTCSLKASKSKIFFKFQKPFTKECGCEIAVTLRQFFKTKKDCYFAFSYLNFSFKTHSLLFKHLPVFCKLLNCFMVGFHGSFNFCIHSITCNFTLPKRIFSLIQSILMCL